MIREMLFAASIFKVHFMLVPYYTLLWIHFITLEMWWLAFFPPLFFAYCLELLRLAVQNSPKVKWKLLGWNSPLDSEFQYCVSFLEGKQHAPLSARPKGSCFSSIRRQRAASLPRRNEACVWEAKSSSEVAVQAVASSPHRSRTWEVFLHRLPGPLSLALIAMHLGMGGAGLMVLWTLI